MTLILSTLMPRDMQKESRSAATFDRLRFVRPASPSRYSFTSVGRETVVMWQPSGALRRFRSSGGWVMGRSFRYKCHFVQSIISRALCQ
jgi:hypothetical protein